MKSNQAPGIRELNKETGRPMAAKKKTTRKKAAARGKGKAKSSPTKSKKRASSKPSSKTATGIVYRDVLHEALAARLGRL